MAEGTAAISTPNLFTYLPRSMSRGEAGHDAARKYRPRRSHPLLLLCGRAALSHRNLLTCFTDMHAALRICIKEALLLPTLRPRGFRLGGRATVEPLLRPTPPRSATPGSIFGVWPSVARGGEDPGGVPPTESRPRRGSDRRAPYIASRCVFSLLLGSLSPFGGD